jgi:hypothetical protein
MCSIMHGATDTGDERLPIGPFVSLPLTDGTRSAPTADA